MRSSPPTDCRREYAALGLTRFSEWTALDSVTVVKGLAFQLSFDLDDLENTEALVAYTRAGNARGFNGQALFFEDLFRSAPFEPVAVIPSKAVAATTRSGCRARDASAASGQGELADGGRARWRTWRVATWSACAKSPC